MHESPNTWFYLQPNTYLSLTMKFLNSVTKQSSSNVSSRFLLTTTIHYWFWIRMSNAQIRNLSDFCNFVIDPWRWRFLMPWNGILKRHLGARGCNRRLTRKPCQAYGRNGTKTVGLFELWKTSLIPSSDSLVTPNCIHRPGTRARQKGFPTWVPCSHRLHQLWDFSPYVPTFYRWHLSEA